VRLRIQHHTRYLYSRPVEFGRHRLVIRPREGHDLHIERMNLRIQPAHTLMWVRDVFGNSIALADFTSSGDVLDIESDVIVERLAPFPARDMHEPVRLSFPVTYDALERTITSAYLVASFNDELQAVRSWVDRELAINAEDAEGTMLRLCELIFRRIRYQRRSEKGVQSPGHTLEVGSGSCRDLATLMMDSARSLGVAARFASGYLHGEASLAGEASTHAWTEVYLPALGWRGFDPTSGKLTSPQHVVTGVSDHPRGVMPITGAFVGERSDFRDMIVQVRTEELS
jgi:transglutaminase-like putative cysteine protease